MARVESTQLSIRSRFARERAASLALRTGMTTTQVVEEALRAYLPPTEAEVSARLVRKGALLVKRGGGEMVRLDEANAALDEVRGERG